MSRTHSARAYYLILKLALAAILLPALAGLGTWRPALADDHREAPLIMLDPVADISDIYSSVFQPDANVFPLGILAMIPGDIDPATWGDTSMLLELGSDIPDPLTGPFTVPFELTQLSLRSSVPVVVTNPDGTTEQWDVELGLSPATASTGTLNLLPGGSNFGSFSIELQLYSLVTFTNRDNGEVRTFDYGMQAGGTIPLSGSGSFSLACPPDRMTIPGVTTPFCLGHDFLSGNVFPVTLIDSGNPSNPRFSTRVEPTPANNPPVLNTIGNMTMNEGGRLGRTIGASDPDGDSLTFSVDGLPDFVTFIDRGDGIAIFDSMSAVGDAGVYTITVTVTDGRGGSDSETFTLTVVGNNRPPELQPIGPLEALDGTTSTFFFSATDPDGDNLTFSIQNAPAYSQFVDNGDGTAMFSVTPPAGSAPDAFDITVTVTDDGAPPLSDSETFTLNVAPGSGNNPPVIEPIGDLTAREFETTNHDGVVRATDPNADMITLSAMLPVGCILIQDVSLPGLAEGDIQCDPDVVAGIYTVTVTATDSRGAIDSKTFTLTVQPFLDTGGDQTVVQDGQVQLNPTASPGAVVELDLDNDGAFESPAPAIFDATGLAPGDYLVGVRALRNGVFNTGSITVTVVPPEDQMLVLELDDLTLNVGDSRVFNAFVGPPNPDGTPDVGVDGVPGTTDDDFQPASVNWETDRGTVNPTSGSSTTYTAPAEPGSDQVRASDADGRTASADITVRRAWTYDDLRRLTFEYVDNPFVARGLALLVDLAAAADSRGFDRFADGILDAYMRGIRAITPRLLTPAERDELISGAQALQQQ